MVIRPVVFGCVTDGVDARERRKSPSKEGNLGFFKFYFAFKYNIMRTNHFT